MQSLRFTIYEILGYVAPGIVSLVALLVFMWAAFLPNAPLLIARYSLSKEEIATLLFATYAFGHLIQGLCNFHSSPEKSAKKSKRHDFLLLGARKTLASRYALDLQNYDIGQIASLAQTSLLQNGKTDDFDVLLYREGFYRGSSASYFLLAIALLFRTYRAGTFIIFHSVLYRLNLAPLGFAAALSLAFAFVFYQRYIRFGNYRLQHLLNFACLPEKTPAKAVGKAKDADGSDSSDEDEEIPL